jgi:Concanavalin A-like lectin/glucanases superfamily/FlgD Ig-like domain
MPVKASSFRGAVQSLVLICLVWITAAGAAQGPIAAWSFDSTVGGLYADNSGNGYDAAPSGTGLSLVAGVKGNALSCPDTGFDIDVLGSANNFTMNSVTVETWYCPNSFPAVHAKLFDFTSVASGVRNGFGLYMVQQGNVEFSLAGASTWITAHSSMALSLHKWYHVVGTYDGNNACVYINGVLANSVAYTGGIVYPVGADARIGCGKLQNGVNWCFARGAIDEMRIFNYALTQDTILAHYRNEAPASVILIPVVPNPTYNQKPLFRWFSKKNVPVYRLEISTVQTFLSSVVSVPLSDTFYVPSAGLPFGMVFWKVADDADTSVWSDISSVTIQDTAIPILIPYAPDPTRNRRPRLSWHHVTGAASFTIQINSTPSFTSPFISDGTTDTFYTPGANLPIGSIFWHVKSDLRDQYSVADTFVVLNDSIPFLIAVSPDSQYIRKPVLKWHPGTGATSYRLQVDTMGDFANPFISIPLSDTVDTPSVDLPYGKICWRVSANTNSTRYSSIDTFWIVKSGSVLQPSHLSMTRWVSLSTAACGDGIRVGYVLHRPGEFSLQIYTTAGRCVATLWKGACGAGEHTLQWQARDDRGNPFPNGGYIITCRLDGRLSSTKCILLAR